MDLRQLKYFVQIVESGNFSRAADLLRIAQPSLSQRMKRLEDELGAELLVRHARGVSTTDLGRGFYDHARRILDEVERTKDAIRLKAAKPSGRVAVGLPTSACRGLALPLFEALQRDQPNITLHVVEAMTAYLDDFVKSGRLDVALLYDHKAYEHVAWTEMITEDLMLLVRKDDPKARRRSIPFAALADLPIVLPGRPNVAWSVIEQAAARCEVTLKPLECDSLPAIVKLVCKSHFVAVLPHFAFLDEISRGEMVAIPIVDPTPSWRLSVVVSGRTMNIRGSQVVAETMAEVIGEMVERGAWRARLTGVRTPSNGKN